MEFYQTLLSQGGTSHAQGENDFRRTVRTCTETSIRRSRKSASRRSIHKVLYDLAAVYHNPVLPSQAKRQHLVTGKRVLKDHIIQLTGIQTKNSYPQGLQMIEFYDEVTKKRLIFLTNNMKLATSTIAAILTSRWQAKLFFTWIKQNLRIKSFLGTCKNAVMTRIWVAMSHYLLLTHIKYQTKHDHSLLALSRLIRETLFWTNLLDIFTLKPERLLAYQDDTLQRSLF